MFPCDSLRIQS